ncbi:hypothetical protein ABTE61_18845, partial [Acinetobacter baumannii]
MDEKIFGSGDDQADEEYEREKANKNRKLVIAAWKARDELYKQLFGEPSYIDPPNYAAPKPEIDESKKKKSSKYASDDTGDPGDPD